jgi:hypothetical protein
MSSFVTEASSPCLKWLGDRPQVNCWLRPATIAQSPSTTTQIVGSPSSQCHDFCLAQYANSIAQSFFTLSAKPVLLVQSEADPKKWVEDLRPHVTAQPLARRSVIASSPLQTWIGLGMPEFENLAKMQHERALSPMLQQPGTRRSRPGDVSRGVTRTTPRLVLTFRNSSHEQYKITVTRWPDFAYRLDARNVPWDQRQLYEALAKQLGPTARLNVIRDERDPSRIDIVQITEGRPVMASLTPLFDERLRMKQSAEAQIRHQQEFQQEQKRSKTMSVLDRDSDEDDDENVNMNDTHNTDSDSDSDEEAKPLAVMVLREQAKVTQAVDVMLADYRKLALAERRQQISELWHSLLNPELVPRKSSMEVEVSLPLTGSLSVLSSQPEKQGERWHILTTDQRQWLQLPAEWWYQLEPTRRLYLKQVLWAPLPKRAHALESQRRTLATGYLQQQHYQQQQTPR